MGGVATRNTGKDAAIFFELGKRGVFIDGDVRPRSWCPQQVSLQEGCALADGNVFELHVLTGAAPENGSSTGCAYILDPAHILSEHRH